MWGGAGERTTSFPIWQSHQVPRIVTDSTKFIPVDPLSNKTCRDIYLYGARKEDVLDHVGRNRHIIKTWPDSLGHKGEGGVILVNEEGQQLVHLMPHTLLLHQP